MPAYTVPTDPVDPEAAALELIVRLIPDVLGREFPTRETLEEFSSVLRAAGVFTGMSWFDARHCASAIIVDATSRDDPAKFLHWRAGQARACVDGMLWVDRVRVVRALTVAASILEDG